MSSDPLTVFVVDDDEQARRSVCALVHSMGLRAESFASAEEFLACYAEGRRGCLVTDQRMQGISGLELQEILGKRGVPLPVIVITAFARTSSTVRAIKGGAVALLEKPYQEDDLWEAIRAALAEETARYVKFERRRELRARIGRLTAEQRKVMDLIVQGHPNKAIAHQLGISVRTVENRRHEVLERMGAGSVAELVRLAIEAEAD